MRLEFCDGSEFLLVRFEIQAPVFVVSKALLRRLIWKEARRRAAAFFFVMHSDAARASSPGTFEYGVEAAAGAARRRSP